MLYGYTKGGRVELLKIFTPTCYKIFKFETNFQLSYFPKNSSKILPTGCTAHPVDSIYQTNDTFLLNSSEYCIDRIYVTIIIKIRAPITEEKISLSSLSHLHCYFHPKSRKMSSKKKKRRIYRDNKMYVKCTLMAMMKSIIVSVVKSSCSHTKIHTHTKPNKAIEKAKKFFLNL